MKTSSKAASLHQELVNSESHGIGVLFRIICITATFVYEFGLLIVFTFSIFYYSFQQPVLKQLLKIFSHIGIYFLIAGTYASLIIIFVNNQFGDSILLALWSLTILGINFKISFAGKFEILSTGIYLLLCLLLLAGGKTFFIAMPSTIIALILTGSVILLQRSYFIDLGKIQVSSGVSHLFVLFAGICHTVAVL